MGGVWLGRLEAKLQTYLDDAGSTTGRVEAKCQVVHVMFDWCGVCGFYLRISCRTLDLRYRNTYLVQYCILLIKEVSGTPSFINCLKSLNSG